MKFLILISVVSVVTADNSEYGQKYDSQVTNWGYDELSYQEQYRQDDYDRDEQTFSYPEVKEVYGDESDEKQTYGKYNDRDFGKKNRENLVGLGKNDREDIVRPCPLEDWQCIRKYFARNSNCKPVHGPAPDPLYLRRNTLYFSNVNITLILTRLRVTGLGSIKISEFYVNKDTGNLVLALDFKNINQTSPKAYFRYKRPAKESIVLEDDITIEFSSGTFTAVIPKIPHLRLDLAEVHADIDDYNPKRYMGPGVYNSKDPNVISAWAGYDANFPINIREGFLFQSQLLTAIYIQENICDFGLKLISV